MHLRETVRFFVKTPDVQLFEFIGIATVTVTEAVLVVIVEGLTVIVALVVFTKPAVSVDLTSVTTADEVAPGTMARRQP